MSFTPRGPASSVALKVKVIEPTKADACRAASRRGRRDVAGDVAVGTGDRPVGVFVAILAVALAVGVPGRRIRMDGRMAGPLLAALVPRGEALDAARSGRRSSPPHGG